MTCQLPYHKSKDNLTSFLFETGAISEVGNNILDLNLFRQVNKQIENDLNNSYGIQASPFIEDDLTGSQTFYTNDKVFERIDEVRKELGLYEDVFDNISNLFEKRFVFNLNFFKLFCYNRITYRC